MTSEPGSFARSTIEARKPQIIAQVIADNDYSLPILEALAAFREEIATGPMQPLQEAAPDVAGWNQALARFAGGTWLEVPWYWAEVFFYRRLLEAVRYFQPGPWGGRDPFARQKAEQVDQAVARLTDGWAQLATAPADLAFEALLHACLWGNRADLSNLAVMEQARDGLLAAERELILIDHSRQVEALLAAGVARVDFVNDNVGLDVLHDLVLADFLLEQGWAGRVVCHLKNTPFFVSDAMPEDVLLTVEHLEGSSTAAIVALARRLRAALSAGRLSLREDAFWTGFAMFRQFPPHLRAELGRSDLVILKGDVNYRRLLSDRHWPFTTPMEEAAGDFPAPFLVLRTLKGEIMVGLQPGQAEALAAADPAWLINGKRGVVQYVPRRAPVKS